MKKLITLLLPLALAAALTTAPQASEFVSSPSLIVNGKVFADAVYKSGDNYLIPLRTACSELGIAVNWSPEDKTILVDNGEMHTTVTIGTDSYIVSTSNPELLGTSAPFSLGTAPVIVDSSAYVPAELFVPLYGNDSSVLTVNETSIIINTLQKNNADEKNNIGLPNPLTNHKTLDELSTAVGFTVNAPDISDSYEITSFTDIDKTLAQIKYRSNTLDTTLTYRMSKGTDDNSGDYNIYDYENTITVNGTDITIKGGNNTVSVALWNKAGFSYSICTDKNGISLSQITEIIKSIDF